MLVEIWEIAEDVFFAMVPESRRFFYPPIPGIKPKGEKKFIIAAAILNTRSRSLLSWSQKQVLHLSWIKKYAMLPAGKRLLIWFAASVCAASITAQTTIPSYYKQEKRFDAALQNIIRDLGLDSSFNVGEDGQEQISLAVIDLHGKRPVFGGVNPQNFIYPASVYKMYVAMEILGQVSRGKYSLHTPYIVQSPNDVDRSKEIAYDPRPLLKSGDTVSIRYLLDLMITRSDNSAANCLIDVAGRPNINKNMQENNWAGSEVTRKFLSRKVEDEGYENIRGTETCALHAADFLYKIYRHQLLNRWVSMQMEALLAAQLDTTKLSTGLPASAMFYHKTGWWSNYTHDVGIVNDGQLSYIIAAFIPLPEEQARPKLKELSQKVYGLMKGRH